MAKGANKKAKVVETPKTEPKKVKLTEKERLYALIVEDVAKYNKAKKFNEPAAMVKLDEQMRENLAKYTVEAEGECFDKLLATSDPMAAAARVMKFETIKFTDKKEKGVVLDRTIEPAMRAIDPLRLHKRAKDGIGADPRWASKIENLNVLMTVATAIALDKDGDQVRSTIQQSDASKEVTLSCKDDPLNDELFKNDLTTVIRAMLGGEYEATDPQVHFLRSAHEKAGRDGRSLVCTNASTMRVLLLGVCHDVLTGEGFDLIYKVASK